MSDMESLQQQQNGPERDRKGLLHIMPWEKLLTPFSYVMAASLLLLILEKGFHINFSECEFKDNGFTCKISKVLQQLDDAKKGSANEQFDLDYRIKVIENQINSYEATRGRGTQAVISSSDSASGGDGAQVPPVSQLVPAIPVAETIVSDGLAEYLRPVGIKANPLLGKSGFIFVGNNQDQNSKSFLGRTLTDPVLFSSIQPKLTYIVLANLTLRGGQPLNKEKYYLDQSNLGVLRPGMRVRVDGDLPFVVIERGNLKQAWTKVTVIE